MFEHVTRRLKRLRIIRNVSNNAQFIQARNIYKNG